MQHRNKNKEKLKQKPINMTMLWTDGEELAMTISD